MANYGLKIAKQGYDVASASPKDLIFSSSLPCAKIIQEGSVSAVDPVNVNFEAVVAFPVIILSYLYDSATSKYSPVDVEFDATKMYFIGGEAAGSLYYYYVCYA